MYDRESLASELLENGGHATLIGDAAYPMSPFKEQGANQTLLDALVLARAITKRCGEFFPWKESCVKERILTEFESF